MPFIILIFAIVFVVPAAAVWGAGWVAKSLVTLSDNDWQKYGRRARWWGTAAGLAALFLLVGSAYIISLDWKGFFFLFSIEIFCAAMAMANSKRAGLPTHHLIFQILGIASWIPFMGPTVFNGILGGMGWGRPLRINGKIVNPALRPGDAWAKGDKPAVDGLDKATRAALEALWLHDAKKEHASVPAFSRLGWLLAGFGAPPELLAKVHKAALQEIDHARRCFALAEGFGGKAYTVAPIPEITAAAEKPAAAATLAVECLVDGCLLENFNADTAEESVPLCRDEASRRLIEQIAREERFHGELSWEILAFFLSLDPDGIGPRLVKVAADFEKYHRPTATSAVNLPMVLAADAQKLKDYGRLPDEEFDALWAQRLSETRKRLKEFAQLKSNIVITL